MTSQVGFVLLCLFSRLGKKKQKKKHLQVFCLKIREGEGEGEREREREGGRERDRRVRELFPANYAAGFRTKVQIFFLHFWKRKFQFCDLPVNKKMLTE